jgi:hypothetical protein
MTAQNACLPDAYELVNLKMLSIHLAGGASIDDIGSLKELKNLTTLEQWPNTRIRFGSAYG